MNADVDPEFWIPTTPATLTPVPAAQVTELRGARVITGTPGRGWHYDLRADDLATTGPRMVPVLPEADYYRAELDQVEVFAPLVPIDHVWVEQAAPHDPLGKQAGAGSDEPQPHQSVLSRLVSLDTPPPRLPVPARDAPNVTGRRVVVVSPTRERRDLRATTEPYENAEATICLRICAETEWYRWAFTGTPAASTEVPIYLVWVE